MQVILDMEATTSDVKPACRLYIPPDWECHRAAISDLYACNELSEVMSTMKSLYSFSATTKQYKTQITKWGLDKKRIKGSEYKAMLKQKRKREKKRPGKRTQFFLHGNDVSQAKIARFENRMIKQGKMTEDDTLSAAGTPPTLAWRTPSPSPQANHAIPSGFNNPFEPATKVKSIWSPGGFGCSPLVPSRELRRTKSPSLSDFMWWPLWSEYISTPDESVYTSPPSHPYEALLRSLGQKVNNIEDHQCYSDALIQHGSCEIGCPSCLTYGTGSTQSPVCLNRRIDLKLVMDRSLGKIDRGMVGRVMRHAIHQLLPKAEGSPLLLARYGYLIFHLAAGDPTSTGLFYDYLETFVDPSSLLYQHVLMHKADLLASVGQHKESIQLLKSSLGDTYFDLLEKSVTSVGNTMTNPEAIAAVTDGHIRAHFEAGVWWCWFPNPATITLSGGCWFYGNVVLDFHEIWIRVKALVTLTNIRSQREAEAVILNADE